MAIRIDKDIPAPQDMRQGNKEHYPFSQLEVGESFFASNAEYDPKRVRQATYAASKRHNKRFRTRTNRHGIRVWRIG